MTVEGICKTKMTIRKERGWGGRERNREREKERDRDRDRQTERCGGVLGWKLGVEEREQFERHKEMKIEAIATDLWTTKERLKRKRGGWVGGGVKAGRPNKTF